MSKGQDTHNKKTYVLAVWSLIVSIVLALVNFTYQVYRDRTTAKSNDVRFAQLQTSLRILTETVAPQIYKSISDSLSLALTPDPSRAVAALGDVRKNLKVLQSARVYADSDSLAENASILAKVSEEHSTLPETWQVAGELITFRSRVYVSDPNRLEPTDLPNCMNGLPGPVQALSVDKTKGSATFTNPTYQNCQVTLDSAEDDKRINLLLTHGFPAVEFRHCRVVYRGGAISLVTAVSSEPVHLINPKNPQKDSGTVIASNSQTLHFRDCFFDIAFEKAPPEKGKVFTRSLLASDGKEASLDLLGF